MESQTVPSSYLHKPSMVIWLYKLKELSVVTLQRVTVSNLPLGLKRGYLILGHVLYEVLRISPARPSLFCFSVQERPASSRIHDFETLIWMFWSPLLFIYKYLAPAM
ncbi:unnamed protein product [Cuscuta europaea]|uniref:Uncharacterized protein n=1 Tax=Cuscuta europaea TaxID=41803 RepID=A0A9P0ZU70_CUSEU|nr:unnamed protein product [Cuscuta europaea]